jgi:malate dehydrogenase
MSQNVVKVVVSGAAGNIGYALIFRIASGQMFGPNTLVELQLLELEQAMPAMKGVAMELEDCAFPLLKKVSYTSNVTEVMRDANWVILVGAVPRKDGMERSDLLKINGGVFAPIGKAINEQAADNVRVFVVGNPCNTNCLIAMTHAPDVPRDRFYAMTTLDEKRARYQLAHKAGVPLSAVTQMVVWGNHSATQFPDFANARINGKPATEVITDLHWLKEEFIPMIQQRGAAVIKARGASSAASAANAVIGAINNLVFDTPAGECYSMSCCSQGDYGVDKGLIFSFPCVTKNGVMSIVPGFQHDAFAQEKLKIVLDELRKERDMVKEMGLI